MTPTLLLLASAAAAAPSFAVSAGPRLLVAVGDPATVNAAVGAGVSVHLERAWLSPEGPLKLFVDFGHDRFARVLVVEVDAGDQRIEVARAQHLTYTTFVTGVAWVAGHPRSRLRPRVSLATGAALGFYLHPAGQPLSITRWKLLARAEAGVGVRIVRRLGVEISGEWNVVAPAELETLDLGAGPKLRRLFDDYPAVAVRVTYAF